MTAKAGAPCCTRNCASYSVWDVMTGLLRSDNQGRSREGAMCEGSCIARPSNEQDTFGAAMPKHELEQQQQQQQPQQQGDDRSQTKPRPNSVMPDCALQDQMMHIEENMDSFED